MIKKIKELLNTYSDDQLENMELWINSAVGVKKIIVDGFSIDLITLDTELKVNGKVSD